MPFSIRSKLITAFFGIIFPFLLIVGTISIYNLNTIYKGIHEIEDVTVGLPWVMRLQFEIDRVLMPGNDYIITGDKKYIDDFKILSTNVEERLAELEMALTTMRDGAEVKAKREILAEVKKAWQNIKELSQRIFALQDPTGRDAPAGRLYMEEMDYKWAGLAIETLKLWQDIDKERFRKAHDRSEGAWRQAWIILIAGFVILVTVGISFAIYYSKMFVTPINTLHKGADAIAGGDFKTRLVIRTGDEIEQLANGMNEMAAQLDTFTSNLQGMVEERTSELKIERDLAQTYLDVAGVMFVVVDSSERVTLVNKKGAEVLGCPEGEITGKNWFNNFLPERVRDEIRGVFRRLVNGENGSLEYVENPVMTCSGEERLIAWHNTVLRDAEGRIIATLSSGEDITERKKVENALKQRINELEHFRKVTIKRELRMEELQRKVEEMERKLGKG